MSQGTKRRVDVVIVTAIPLEYEAVLKVSWGAVPGSVWREDKQPNGVAYRSFEVPNGRPLEVAVAVAPDMATAAALTTLIPLIEELKPRCIAMCGVCAGRPGKVQLGDVIAAERLYYHDTGKQTREDGKPEEHRQGVRTSGEGAVRMSGGGAKAEIHEQDLRTFNLRPDWKVELERMKPAELFRGQSWLEERPINTEWRARRALWALERGTAEPWREVDGALKDGEWRRVLEVLRAEKWLDGIELTDAGLAEARLRRFEYPGDPDLSPHGDLLPFKLHTAPMASGNKVIEDEKKLNFLVMKGGLDFANHGRDDHFKAFAARGSRLGGVPAVVPAASCGDSPRRSARQRALRRHGAARGDPKSLSGLLRAAHGLVPWRDQGRAALLADLDAWVDDGRHKVSAWLLHAAGGAGKTRLAIEWVRRRLACGELAGFWKNETTVAKLDALVTHPRPLVIVVDYAETAPDLLALLRAIVTHDVPNVEIACQRIRVLLLRPANAAADHRGAARMPSVPPVVRVFVVVAPFDMRGSFDALAGAVRHLGMDPINGHLYLFLNKRRRLAKAVSFDGSGWLVLSKRLAQGSFLLKRTKRWDEVQPGCAERRTHRVRPARVGCSRLDTDVISHPVSRMPAAEASNWHSTKAVN